MKRIVVAALFSLTFSDAAFADDAVVEVAAIEKLKAFSVRALDSRLPEQSLEQWLKDVLPKSATLMWETNDCGEQTGDQAVDKHRLLPLCVGVTAELLGRDRDFILQFYADDPLSAPFFLMTSSSIEAPVEFSWLGDIQTLREQPLALKPAPCLPEAKVVLQQQDAGLFEGCQRSDGVKHGTYRAWYNSGLYLMEVGLYRDGVKSADWVECDRFENCKIVQYPIRYSK